MQCVQHPKGSQADSGDGGIDQDAARKRTLERMGMGLEKQNAHDIGIRIP